MILKINVRVATSKCLQLELGFMNKCSHKTSILGLNRIQMFERSDHKTKHIQNLDALKSIVP